MPRAASITIKFPLQIQIQQRKKLNINIRIINVLSAILLWKRQEMVKLSKIYYLYNTKNT